VLRRLLGIGTTKPAYSDLGLLSFAELIAPAEASNFNLGLIDIADAYWVLSALRRGLRIRVMDRLTSAFTDTGENMNLQPNARAEIRRLRESAPRWAQTLSPVLVLEHRLRKWLSGGYSQKPFSYEIYTLADTSRRLVFRVSNPTCVWRSRLGLKI